MKRESENSRPKVLAASILAMALLYLIFARLRYVFNGLVTPDIIQLGSPFFLPYLLIFFVCLAALIIVAPPRWDIVAPVVFVLFVYALFPLVQLPRFFVPVSDDFFYHLGIGRAAAISGHIPQTSDPYTRYFGFASLISVLLVSTGAASVYAVAAMGLCISAFLDVVNVLLIYRTFFPFLGRAARLVPLVFYAVNTSIYGTIDILGPSKIGFALFMLSLFLAFRLMRSRSTAYLVFLLLATVTLVITHPISTPALFGILLALSILFQKTISYARSLRTIILSGVVWLLLFTFLGPPAQTRSSLDILQGILSLLRFQLHFMYSVPYSDQPLSQAIYWFSRVWYALVAAIGCVSLARVLRSPTTCSKILWATLAGLIVGMSPFLGISFGTWSSRIQLLGMIPLSAIIVLEASRHKRFLAILMLALVLSGPITFVSFHQVTFPFSVNSWDFNALQFVADHRETNQTLIAPTVGILYTTSLNYPGRQYSLLLYASFDFIDVYGNTTSARASNYLFFLSWRESAFKAYERQSSNLFEYRVEELTAWSQTHNSRLYDNGFNTVFLSL
jgi:hypothetical protein